MSNPVKEGPLKEIKCLVWDLDDTLWTGTLLEKDAVELKPGAAEIIAALDGRGILQSIASRNEPEFALDTLRNFGLNDYFLYPQIGWGAKPAAIACIAESLNLGLDAIAFIDDQEFERSQMSAAHPAVLVLSAEQLSCLLDLPELNPRFVSAESPQRRLMYLADQNRTRAEAAFEGPTGEFLATLDMKLTLSAAREEDLTRAAELTVRTHQLNSTGYTYSCEELQQYLGSAGHLLLVADLEDRFGSYGKIGLALVDRGDSVWRLKLLLTSCRVISRGVGSLILSHIMALAQGAGVELEAELVKTGRNRPMIIAYAFAGFKEIRREDTRIILAADFSKIQPIPDYVTLLLPDDVLRLGYGSSAAHAGMNHP